MSSPSPRTCKRIGRGVRNFNFGVWGREKQNAVLSGTYANFMQNLAKTKNLLSSDNKLLAESSPLDPVWSLGLRADDHKANNLCHWRGKISSVRLFLLFAKLFATLRPDRRTRPPLVGSDLQCKCKNQEILSAPRPGR